MTPNDFLRAVLPAEGYYALVGIKNKKIKQTLIGNIDNADQIIQAALSNQEDIYFGCSAYATPDNRKIENVLHIQAFWIDLDCGEGTAYETKQDGFAALRAVCKATGLPKPCVVDSGRGLHVYWLIDDPILVDVWRVYAARLVDLCEASGLKIKDRGCSTDPARILRVPETKNYKDKENPLDVTIVTGGVVTPWLDLKTLIEAKCGEHDINGFHPKKAKPKKKKLDAVTSALMGNSISIFKKIAKLSLAGEGCEQIRYALEHPAEQSEPLWRAVLSVAQVCEDRDKAIHKLSAGYEGYDAQETENKANGTNGPLTCAGFAATCDASLCTQCKFKNGRIIGPIALGKDIARAAPEPEPEPEHLTFTNEDGIVVETSVSVDLIKIPDLPFPYFRGKHGGIYRPGPPVLDGEEGEPTLIYEHDLNLVRRIKDPEKGEVLIVLHSRPQDGTEEIVIPLNDAMSLERMKDKLGYHGVAAHKEQLNKIGTYMINAVQSMQRDVSAEPARSQMGWTEDRKGIVWGRTLFTKEGKQYCPPASKSTTVAGIMKTTGSFQVWEELAERYAAPGFEMSAMCMLMGFGSMLNNYTYEDPVWVHMVSSESGTGKTTLTQMINSIWGDPDAMMLAVKDTVNALEKRRVVFNSMAICQDEITNLPADKISELAYAQSQGREKLRLSQGSQEISNNDRRNNILFTNGNKHISDVLGAFKTNAAGEYARLIEITFQPLGEKASGEKHFGKVLSNYGHAGPIFAQWLVLHEHELGTRVAEERARFEKAFNSVTSERNWVALAAVAFAAGRILQEELGMLMAYDLQHLFDTWLAYMYKVRKVSEENIITHDNVLGDFINDNWANILIPDSAAAAAAELNPTTANLYGRKTEREARNKAVIRWEGNTRKLFVAQSELKTYCAKRSHSFVDMLAYFNKTMQFCLATKRMGAGTDVVTSPIKVLVFSVPVGSELGELLGGDDADNTAT